MKKMLLLILILIVQYSNEQLFAQTNRILKAESYFKNIKYKKALDLFLQEYESDNPHNGSELIEPIANCYRLTGDTRNAELWYEKAIKLDTSNRTNIFYYARMLQINGKHNEARTWFGKYSAVVHKNNIVMNYLMDQNEIEKFERETNRCEIRLLPINSDYSDIAPAYYENQLVFASTRDTFGIFRNSSINEPFFDLYTINQNQIDSGISVSKFDKKINSPYHEGPLVFDPKHDVVYFTRSDFNNKKAGKSTDNIIKLNIYQAKRDNKGWNNIEKLWFNSFEHSIGHPAISADGMVLIFSSDMEGGYGGSDLYFSFWNDTSWSEPINLGDKINTHGNELFPYFSKDGKLYFSSNGRPGLGGLDIYYTWPSFEKIEKIKNMGIPVNSSNDDFGLIVDEKETGYFVSDRPNDQFKSDNIYSFTSFHYPLAANDTIVVDLNVMVNDRVGLNVLLNDFDSDNDLDSSKIRLLRTGLFDKEYSVNGKGEFVYWVNKYFEGVKKVEYEVSDVRGLKDTACIFIVMKGNSPPNANPDYLLTGKNGNGRVIDIVKNDSDKEGNIMLDSVKIIQAPKFGGDFVVERRYFYYKPSENFIGKDFCVYSVMDSRGGVDTDTIFIEVLPEFMGKSVAIGGVLDLSIYFESNKWKINYYEKKKLDKVVDFLKENPVLKSEVSGHTDPTGGSKFNMYLSIKRAKEAANYLRLKGIDKDRLKINGEGENYLIYKSMSGDGYGDDNNWVNRRTTIKVLDM